MKRFTGKVSVGGKDLGVAVGEIFYQGAPVQKVWGTMICGATVQGESEKASIPVRLDLDTGHSLEVSIKSVRVSTTQPGVEVKFSNRGQPIAGDFGVFG